MRNQIYLIVVGLTCVIAACSPSATPVSRTPRATPTALAIPAVALAPTVTPTPAIEMPATVIDSVPGRSVNPDPSGVLPPEVVAAIPDGYELLGEAVGDLNLDGRNDLAIVVREPGDAEYGEWPDVEPVRPVMLFLASPDNTMELAARGDRVALCGRCGGTFGDPFSDITIGAGTVTIGHYGGSAWRWTLTPTFAYDIVEDTWVLTSIDRVSFHAIDPDGTMEDHSETDVEPIPFADYDPFPDS